MIKHKIIVNKEVYEITPIRQQHYQPAPNGVWPPKKQVNNQDELTMLIEGEGLEVGDFLTMVPFAMRLSDIHRVIDIQTDFSKLVTNINTGKAQPYRILKLADNKEKEHLMWDRWDNFAGYRNITDVEYRTYVEPNIDYVQDYCQRHIGQTSGRT